MSFLKKLINLKVAVVVAIIAVFILLGVTYRHKVVALFTTKEVAPAEAIIAEANLGDNYKPYDKVLSPSEGFADLVEFVSPAVVSITAVKVIKSQSLDIPLEAIDPMLREFFKNILPEESKEQRFVSIGSGFVIRSDGFIVTNSHVVKDAEKVQVAFYNGKKMEATLHAIDEVTDIALLKVDTIDIKTLKFGDSTRVRVGDWVIAIGNPFGLGGTVSSGIISAIARDIQIGPYNDFLQTDASINKGNSGGPMINTKGEVIGINTAIFSSQGGGSIGIGFAVPSNVVQNIVSQLITNKKVTRGWLGVQIQSLDDSIAKTLGVENSNGALVSKVMPKSPAEKAGIKTGDTIVSVDGVELKNSKFLPKTIGSIKPGSKITLGLIRNKAKKDVVVTIEEIPAGIQNVSEEEADSFSATTGKLKELSIKELGLSFVEINDYVRKFFKLDSSIKGVVITKVDNSSIAKQKSFVIGLRVVSVNQEDISTLEELQKSVEKNKNSGLLFLVEDPRQNRVFISISKKEVETGFPEN